MEKKKKYKIDEYFDKTEGMITYDSLPDELKLEVDELSNGPIEWLEKTALKRYKETYRTNVFSDLFRYKASDLCSPKENFTTESLVFLLRLSIESDKSFFKQFLSLIDDSIKIKDDDVIHIETQKRFISKIKELSLEAIPDITLIINTLYIFIEVKVDSVLNEEIKLEAEKQFILNQLVKYNNIVLQPNNINQKKICSLTIRKETTDVGFDYNATTWTQIAYLIDNFNETDTIYKKLLIEFSQFLKSENMAIDKVEKSINEGVLNLTNLLLQIKISLTNLKYKPSFSQGELYSGYYIESKEFGFKLWIGYDYKNQTIKIQIVNKELNDFAKENRKYNIDPHSKKYILVSNLLNEHSEYFELTADKQFGVLSEWLELKISELKSYTKSSNKIFKLDF
jgi:hypothetical protein